MLLESEGGNGGGGEINCNALFSIHVPHLSLIPHFDFIRVLLHDSRNKNGSSKDFFGRLLDFQIFFINCEHILNN